VRCSRLVTPAHRQEPGNTRRSCKSRNLSCRTAVSLRLQGRPEQNNVAFAGYRSLRGNLAAHFRSRAGVERESAREECAAQNHALTLHKRQQNPRARRKITPTNDHRSRSSPSVCAAPFAYSSREQESHVSSREVAGQIYVRSARMTGSRAGRASNAVHRENRLRAVHALSSGEAGVTDDFAQTGAHQKCSLMSAAILRNAAPLSFCPARLVSAYPPSESLTPDHVCTVSGSRVMWPKYSWRD
jgi:hypothetical protein